MAEVVARSRRRALPRRNPKTECPVCGGDIGVHTTRERRGWIIRYLKCEDPKCSGREQEHDSLFVVNPKASAVQ